MNCKRTNLASQVYSVTYIEFKPTLAYISFVNLLIVIFFIILSNYLLRNTQ
jgi:hypothetical protein